MESIKKIAGAFGMLSFIPVVLFVCFSYLLNPGAEHISPKDFEKKEIKQQRSNEADREIRPSLLLNIF